MAVRPSRVRSAAMAVENWSWAYALLFSTALHVVWVLMA